MLLPPSPETVIETVFAVENTRHEYQVIKLWEENSELFLNDPALLPLAPLTQTAQPQILLQKVAKIDELEVEQRAEIKTYTEIVAGLKYNKDLIARLFGEGMMRESVIFQDILREGREEGREEGKKAEGRSLVLRLLNRKLGELPSDAIAQIETLSLEQIESLGEALLDFEVIADLEAWLSQSTGDS